MQFSTVAIAAFAAVAVASDYQTVVADIQSLDSKLKQFNESLNNYQGGQTGPALGLEFQSIALGNQIKKATEDANNSTEFGAAGSDAVAKAVLAAEPDIGSVLDNLISKKATLEQPVVFGIKPTLFVKSNLRTFKKDTDDFGKAITSKISAQYQQVAPQIISQIDAEYDKALAAYD